MLWQHKKERFDNRINPDITTITCLLSPKKYIVYKLETSSFSVSEGIKDWLCRTLKDDDFNSVLSLLLNNNITKVYQEYTQPNKTREEVKAELLHRWCQGWSPICSIHCKLGLKFPYVHQNTVYISDSSDSLIT